MGPYTLFNMTKEPLVSCLCISNGRPAQLRNAIAYFKAQTYQHKELIIVSAQHDPAYEEMVRLCLGDSVKYYDSGGMLRPTLGELRNYAIQRSNGEYFCVWDDDDWYHINRIETQIRQAILNKKQGTVLPYYILLDVVHHRAYMSLPIPPPASILCKKNSLQEELYYRKLGKEEDALVLNKLNEKNALFPVINPALYIYNYHGSNTWGWEHIKKFCGKQFSREATGLIVDIVSNKYTCEEGSNLLTYTDILQEFDYFNSFAKTAALHT